MSTKLCYGLDNVCEIAGANVITVRAKYEARIAKQAVSSRVQQAFAHPLDYPPLASATVPGDTVAIALQYGTPQPLQVLMGTLEALANAGVASTQIAVLLAPEFAGEKAFQRSLRELIGSEVTVAVHCPDEAEQLSLLGVTEAGRALRLNRILCEADLVIPLGPVRGSKHDLHAAGLLFPQFSDQETVGRFNSPSSYESVIARKKLSREIAECDWILGVGLELYVVPGPNGEIADIYCGTPRGAMEAARNGYLEIWSSNVDERADLIVATIVGDDAQQTWQSLSRALAIADELLETGGAIAICSEIAGRPGPACKRLLNAPDLMGVERKLLIDQFADSIASLTLCRLLQRGTIYLKSRLDAALIEGLGMAPICSDQELERLTKSYRRCIVLEEAQHLEPKLAHA